MHIETPEELIELAAKAIDSCLELACGFYRRQMFSESERTARAALEIASQGFPADDLRMAQILHDLGDYQAVLGKHLEASPNLKKALLIRTEVLGDQAKECNATRFRLTMTLDALGSSAWEEYLAECETRR